MATNQSLSDTQTAIVYLTRRATFSASHRLHNTQLSHEENQAIFGKCNNANGHGHNYILEVTLRGPINPKTGFVMNLRELEAIIDEAVIQRVDHRHLNLDVPAFADLTPTSENIAVVFWNWLAQHLPCGLLYELKLHETENNVVVYRGNTSY